MAKAINVAIEGLDDLLNKLARAAVATRQGATESVKQTAESIEDFMKENVPVDRGDLHDSIGIEFQDRGLTAEIGTRGADVFYGQFVEFGTSKQEAQPFVGPAGEPERKNFPDRVVSRVEQRISKL